MLLSEGLKARKDWAMSVTKRRLFQKTVSAKGEVSQHDYEE